MTHAPYPFRRRSLFLAAMLFAGIGTASAEGPIFKLTIANQKFEPAELQVPAGQKIELHITNSSNAAVEFESHDLRREKIIAPGQTAIVYVGPLRVGSYTFFDDFHPTTRGQLIAR